MTGSTLPDAVLRTQNSIELFWRHIVAIGFLLLLSGVVVLQKSQISSSIDHAVLDSQQRLLAASFPKIPAQSVVVVGIDEQSVARVPEPLALWHAYLGQFLSAMALAKPTVVGLDIVLPDRSFDAVVRHSDRRLLEGLLAARGATSVVLGLTVDNAKQVRKIYPPFAAVLGQDALGYVLLDPDSDNVVRTYNDRFGEGAQPVPTLTGQMARHFGVTVSPGWIDYAIRTQPRYVPFHQVLEWMERKDTAALQVAFSGKAVLLGSVLYFDDRHPQPINLAVWERNNSLSVPGVLIHAQILSTMLNNSMIVAPHYAWTLLVFLAVCLLWWIPLRLSHAALLCCVILATGYGATASLLYHGTYFQFGSAALLVIAAIFGRWTVDSLLQIRERHRLRSTFGGYVSPQLMDEILAGRLTGSLGGEMRTVCIMFADVRGFTTLSEKLPPQEIIELLNLYFELVTQAIHEEGGTLNCIMGDGIMAIFGAPKSMENPSLSAFAAARRILRSLPDLNRKLVQEGKPTLSLGIGLNLGPAIVGHIGSRARHDYSAIGDTTNVASRLEGLTKSVAYPLVCSQTVAQAIGFPEGLSNLGTHPIKGRSDMVLFGWKEPVE